MTTDKNKVDLVGIGDMDSSLRGISYDGVISFESVYHPGNGSFEDGFRAGIELFKQHFA